jgi:hypothetical protein
MKSTDLTVTGLVGPGTVSPPSAAARERSGRFWMLTGAVITALGIALYSTTMLIGDINQEPVRLWAEGLTTIGAGLAVWLFGTLRSLRALVEMGPADDSL